MILELDAGNSRIKWRLLHAESKTLVASGRVSGVSELSDSLPATASISLLRVASVRGAQLNGEIVSWAAARGQFPCKFAEVQQQWGQVRIQYDDPKRLGVDRWLTLVAAFNRAAQAWVIVDGGTALTVDVLQADGLHKGGYIIPGIQLMKEALKANTGIRLGVEATASGSELGNSTDSAVNNGVNAAVLGCIRQGMEQAGGAAKLLLSGGDAPVLARLLKDESPEIAADLVFEGLGLVCPT